MCILYYYYVLKGLDHMQLASQSKNYSGPGGRPREKSLANIHSLVAHRERSLPIALRERSSRTFPRERSVFLLGTFLACVFSRTFSREPFLVNVVL